MSKRINIPLVGKHFHIYVGEKEWPTWYRAVKREGGLHGDDTIDSPPRAGGGRCWYGWIWVHDTVDTNTVFHEVSHILARLYEISNCERETEFKAYLAGEILSKVHAWLNEVNRDAG